MSQDYEDEDFGQDDAEAKRREPLPTEAAAASGRLLLPGIFMIVTGIVNLVPGATLLWLGYQVPKLTDANLQEILDQMNPAQRAQMADQMGIAGPTELRKFYYIAFDGGGGVILACALLTLVGGICMCARKARWLAVISALVTLLPVASPCCLLGMPVGVWALVVLLARRSPQSVAG